jgi:DNA polymerase-1
MSNTTYHTLGIDGDIVAYRAAAALEKPTHWGGDLWTLHCNANEVIEAVDETLTSYKNQFKADRLIIALSDSANFRKELNPTYKSNRTKQRRPVCLPQVREHMKKVWGAVTYPRLEADDVLGIKATSTKESFLLISIDKDFKAIPCHLWNPDKDELTTMTQGLADYHHMIQTLTGDATDGYAGCPSFGIVTATKLLGEPREVAISELWPLVVNAFAKKALGEDQAILMARMARILRHGEYNMETNKISLWKPE